MKTEKTIWVLDAGGTKVASAMRINSAWEERVYTQGIVPYMLKDAELLTRLRACYADFAPAKVNQVFYYGSGCNIQENQIRVKCALQQILPEAEIQVMHDVLGAARAVCGYEAGIAAILGTGSSACFYSGKQIEFMRPGLGYILGDEGSGADLGRRLLCKVCYAELDKELLDKFATQYQLDADAVIDRVYNHSGANKFLASFAKFLYDNLEYPQIQEMLYASLRSFVELHLKPLANLSKCKELYFVGSIAYYHRDVLAEILSEYGLVLAKILRQPISGLVTYHS